MSIKIGIVDDDAGTVRAFTEYAVNLGYEVASARDGEEGFQLFQKERPDILLLDGLLPKLHGFDLCKKIKGSPEGKDTPVLLVSGVYRGHKYRNQASREFLADGYFEKPVNIRKLFEQIGELTKNQTDFPVSFKDEHLRLKKFQEENFPSLLHKLYDEQKTGTLFLERDHIRKSIYFKQGYISFAVSNQKHERLGDLLLADQKITAGRFNEVSEIVKKTGKLFGLILLDAGQIDASTLERYLQKQMENILYDIFTWQNGYYDFVHADDGDEFMTLKTAPAHIILQGIRNTYTSERLDRYFPETDIIFLLAQDPRYRFQALQLDEKEEKIVTLLNGVRTVEEVIREADLPSIEVRKFLYGLFLSRIIEKKGASQKVDDFLVIDDTDAPPIDQDLRKSILQKHIQVQSQNPYEILEISKTKDQKVIKKAFLKMAKTYHPDRYFHRLDDKYNDYVKVIFQTINRTYQELSEMLFLLDREGNESSSFGLQNEKAVREDNVSRAEHFFEKGIDLYRQGDREGAQNALISAIQINPKEAEYHLLLGRIFLEETDKARNNLELAESALNYAVNLSASDARPFFYLGCVYKLNSEVERSEVMFRKALERDPKYIEATRELRLMDKRKKKSVRKIIHELIGSF